MRRLILAVLALSPALALGQGVSRPYQQPETILMVRNVAGLLTAATYTGVLLPGRAFQVTAFTTRTTAAAVGAGTCNAVFTDGTNTCTCSGNCATSGSTGWGDAGNKRIACTGTCLFPAGASIAFQIAPTCATTQPNALVLEARGYWR